MKKQAKQTEQRSPTHPPAFFTLPYTGDKVPTSVADITVKITGEMMAREGVAFNAEVRRAGKVIGTIENQGNGGGTWFHHHGAEAMRWWNDAVEEMKQILVHEGEDYVSLAGEMLADRLYENMATFRDLNRKRSVLIRFNRSNDDIRIFKGTWDADMQAYFTHPKTKAKGETHERWIKGKGWEVV